MDYNTYIWESDLDTLIEERTEFKHNSTEFEYAVDILVVKDFIHELLQRQEALVSQIRESELK